MSQECFECGKNSNEVEFRTNSHKICNDCIKKNHGVFVDDK